MPTYCLPPQSIAQQIRFRTDIDDFEQMDMLQAEVKQAEANGFDPDPEVLDAIEEIRADWDRCQQGEIEAEMAIERYYENIGYDTDGIWR